MLPYGKMAFANYSKRIRIINNDGSPNCDVRTPDWAFDFEYIAENDTFAVVILENTISPL